MADQILYEDNTVTLTNMYLTIRKYYFPFASSKTILFQDIEKVQIQKSEGAELTWGICTKFLNNWFPLDTNRKNKKQFISIQMKGRRIKPSFTPDDAKKVFQIIWQNHTPEGRQQVQRRSSQVGKQTQIDQQEAMNRMKQEKEQKEENEHQMTENNLAQQVKK